MKASAQCQSESIQNVIYMRKHGAAPSTLIPRIYNIFSASSRHCIFNSNPLTLLLWARESVLTTNAINIFVLVCACLLIVCAPNAACVLKPSISVGSGMSHPRDDIIFGSEHAFLWIWRHPSFCWLSRKTHKKRPKTKQAAPAHSQLNLSTSEDSRALLFHGI